MKTYVFSYQLMVKDMAGGGINPDLSACKVYQEIDGRHVFVDKENNLMCCYALHEGNNYPTKYYVPSSWCEGVEL